MSTAQQPPGPWEAIFYVGSSSARFWTLRRFNPKWMGHFEIKQTAGWKPVRYKTEAAATAAAEAANAATQAGSTSSTPVGEGDKNHGS